MEDNRVKFLINMIKEINEEEKIKLAVKISESNYTNLDYDKGKC